MKFDEFKLERWLLREAEINIGGGGVSKLVLGDLVAGLDLDQKLKYGRTDGSNYLKGLVAEWYGVESEEVLITSGTSEANLLVNLALLESSDVYMTEVPMYVQTVGVARALGCRIDEFHLREGDGWRPDLEGLKESISTETRIVFLDNPNNPTGALLKEAEMKSICEIAGDAGAWVHCDNALRGSELNRTPGLVPFPDFEHSVVTGSVSKLRATSPRIGWILGPKKLVERCWMVKDYTTLGHSRLGEMVAARILMLRKELMERNLAYSMANIYLLGKWVDNNPKVSWMEPQAGFTGFPRYDHDIRSAEFCERLLHEEGVLMSPGAFFGQESHLRICIGVPTNILREGLDRIEAFMDRLE